MNWQPPERRGKAAGFLKSSAAWLVYLDFRTLSGWLNLNWIYYCVVTSPIYNAVVKLIKNRKYCTWKADATKRRSRRKRQERRYDKREAVWMLKEWDFLF